MQNAILDTQIISYAYKGVYDGSVNFRYISSVTAKEFLLLQDSRTMRVNYYVPRPTLRHKGEALAQRTHPFSKHTTDQIIIDFGKDYPAIVEWSNLAIAQVINWRERGLFAASVHFLDKKQRKEVRRRFEFLLDHQVRCIPLHAGIVNLGLDFFEKFRRRYTPKKNFRNTFYDILILSTARYLSASLVTDDALLKRFAAEVLQAKTSSLSGRVVSVNFEDTFMDERKRRRSEHRGYVNRGWSVSFKKSRGA